MTDEINYSIGLKRDVKFSWYQKRAHETAVYPSASALDYLMAGLGGEVGELLSLYAKHKRGDVATLDLEKLSKELGDVLWFVAELSTACEISLDEIAEKNLEKLSSRQARGTLKGSGDDR